MADGAELATSDPLMTQAAGALSTGLVAPGASPALEVNITAALASVDVMHHGRKVTIVRNQNQNNMVNPDFAKTSRKCPPFCIQPGELAPGVKTIGELEVLQFLKKINDGDASIMVVDSRTPNWVEKGTIPGTMNIPWDKLDIDKSGSTAVQEILEKLLNARRQDGFWNFNGAKTLVMFCNGSWCGQSPTNIRDLMKIGYPAHKIFWYRGGMQDWENLGLTTIKPESE
jgi:rhodanese-related sulfurtransferase